MEFVGLEGIVLDQLRDTFKDIDVTTELKKMGLWLTSAKGRKRVGNIGFILNWLQNSSPSTSNAAQLDLFDANSPLRPYLLQYCKELWKDREHILEINTITKP
jgi:hypothetical protein